MSTAGFQPTAALIIRRMHMSSSAILKMVTLGLATSFIMVGVAHAGPNGVWKRSNGAHIKVFNCGGGLGMRVTKSPTPSKVGKTIMCGAKPNGKNKWKGSLHNLDDGQTYLGYVKLHGKSLSLSGCVLGGLICKSDTWHRIR